MEDSRGPALDRRQVLAGAAGALSLSALPGGASAQGSDRFLIGCWARAPERLALMPLNRVGGEWRWGAPIESIRNVFHGYTKPKTGKFYLALDSKEDAIVRASVGKSGGIVEEGRWGSGGGEPSFVDGDRTGRYIAVANFEASVSVYRDGQFPELIATRTTTIDKPGPLPRQDRPHFHSAKFSPDNKFIYACDMGGDQILAYPFDDAKGRVGEQIHAFKTAPGSGPRHTQFHRSGRYCYVMNELDATLATFRLEPDGKLTQIAIQSTVPDPNYKGYNHGGHIDTDPTGRFLYISNRGHNTLGVFAIGPEGELKNLQWISSGGDWPWFFLLAGQDFIVCNWNNNNVSFFTVKGDGTLAATGKSLTIKNPAYVMKLPG